MNEPAPGRRARIEAPDPGQMSARIRCFGCGRLLGWLELEGLPGAGGAIEVSYRRTAFTDGMVPRGRNAATKLPAYGPRGRVRQGRGGSPRRREPGSRGESFWASLKGPAYVYCEDPDCNRGQVVDPADLDLPPAT